MSDTTLNPVHLLDADTIKKINRYITVVMMLLGLLLSTSLLQWAVKNKMAQPDMIEATAITADVRERQLGCLARNIYYEAGSEPFEGKVAVAQVTLNRAQASDFPEDVCHVIYQKNIVYQKVLCQFSWVCDRPNSLKPINSAVYAESMIVAKKVLLENFRLPSLKDALYFHGDYINPGWKKEQVAHIGRHIFYK
jgi:spore germination cell wall hydrolase CwlJ-like protein